RAPGGRPPGVPRAGRGGLAAGRARRPPARHRAHLPAVAPAMMSRPVAVVLVVLSFAAAMTFLVLAVVQLGAPAELDYIEGVMLDRVARLAHGEPIYVAPSLAFVALAYMPGIAWVSSWLAIFFGPALWEPRLVNLLAVLVLTGIIATIVRRETGSRVYAIG